MATIYRVENKKGEGFYYSNDYKKIGISGNSERAHVGPMNDRVLKKYFGRAWFGGWEPVAEPAISWMMDDTLRFGFPSIEAVSKWLYRPEWLYKLDTLGYRIGIYEAPDVLLSKAQAVFNIKTATKTGELRLTELEPMKEAA